jgi:hypothetical protein
MKKLFVPTALLLSGWVAFPVQAAEVLPPGSEGSLFWISGSINGESEEFRSFTRIETLVESLKQENLNEIFQGYTENSAVDVLLNVRNPGKLIEISIEQGSPIIVMSIPSLSFTKSFTGSTRDESQEQFEDFLKANGENILQQILQAAVAQTPVDPVAGNPNSLMSTMGSADFAAGVDFTTSADATPTGEARVEVSTSNSFGIGLRFGRFSAGDFDQDVFNLPLSYTYRFDSDPRKQLLFDFPLTYSRTQDAESFGASFGLGYRFPVNDDWSLTPAVRVGALGSVDLGAAAIIYSGSLTSNYNLYWDDLKVSIGNMGGYYRTTSIESGDFKLDYDLTNGLIKNGIGVEGPVNFRIFGNPTSWQFSTTHTLFTGDDLFVDQYVDVAFSFGTRATQSQWDRLRLGVTYTKGNNDFSGFQANFGYTF